MNPKIPLIAIVLYSLLIFLIYLGIIPNPLLLIDYIKTLDSWMIYAIMFLIILLESIAYVGFYLPWQFIAVIVVVSFANSIYDILLLTFVSIIAVTIWATINYYLWYYLSKKTEKKQNINYKKLFLSLIHINTISLFVFDQWLKKAPKKIILLTWLLNLPYYFLIIMVTYVLQDQVMQIGENSYIIFVLLFLWLAYSLYSNSKKWINLI